VDVTGTSYAPEGEFHRGARVVPAHEDAVLLEALRIGALANRADLVEDGGRWRAVGDPTEAALLVVARKAGLERERLHAEQPELWAVPFSSERQWMATSHRTPAGGIYTCVKGAPGWVVESSSRELTTGGERPLDAAGRARLLAWNRRLAGRGLRVLAVARSDGRVTDHGAVHGLTFVGFVGITDPPAPGVRETILRLRDSGIRTIMITGDQRLTAVSVARQLALIEGDEGAMDGRELASLDETALDARLARTGVFDRVSPADKLRIVDALQRRHQIVAMLGDGVNDAAALRKADIGVAMGIRGTDIAKEAADVVLADDRFPTIAAAVEQGRVIFDNIRKFVFYLFSCNLAEVLLLMLAAVVGLPQPLLPLQILWLNLVTDTFPALSLAVEPPEDDVMRRPPRDPDKAILSRRFVRGIASYAALIAAATLTAFVLALGRGDPTRAGTVAFATLGLAQAFHLGNARSVTDVLARRRVLSNPWALGAVGLVTGLQIVAIHLPALAAVLRVVPLTLAEWGLVLGAASIPALVGQALRVGKRRRLATRQGQRDESR
jgi:Ca2+-transporting ATPase